MVNAINTHPCHRSVREFNGIFSSENNINNMSKSTPINVIETDDDQTIQQVLEDLDADIDDEEDQYMGDDYNEHESQSRHQTHVQAQAQSPPHHQSKTQNEGLQLPNLTNDITDVIIVFSVFLIVSNLPVEQLIYRYISLEHIPLSKTIIKATISAALFVMIKKIIKFI